MLLPFTGFALIMFVSYRWGIGMTTDSASYLATASNLAAGRGYVIFNGYSNASFIWFPPLYPLALAAVTWLGIDLFSAALVLNAFLFAAVLLVVSMMINVASLRSRFAWFWGVIYFATSINVLQAYGYVWSEALFLPLFLLSVWLTHLSIARGTQAPLLAASLVMGFAILTRYAGVSLPLAASIALVLKRGKRFVHKIADIAVVSAFPLIMFVGWSLRNWVSSDSATGRNLSFSVGIDTWLQMFYGLLSWIGGASLLGFSRFNLAVFISIPALILVSFLVSHWWVSYKKHPVANIECPLQVFSIFGLIYFFFICGIWVSVADISASAETPRILLPAQAIAVVIGTVLIDSLTAARPSGASKRIRAALVALLVLNFAGAAIWSTYKYAYGLGIRSEKWMPIASILGATDVHPESIVYSNFPQALYCITRKEARFVRMADLTTKENYVREIEQNLRRNGGMIVFFKDGIDNKELITVPSIMRILTPDQVEENSVGIVLRYASELSPH